MSMRVFTDEEELTFKIQNTISCILYKQHFVSTEDFGWIHHYIEVCQELRELEIIL